MATPVVSLGGNTPTAQRVVNKAPVRQYRVLVANGKGGCGKTTIATNIAGYYASQKRGTALLDYDPQGSSMQWLSLRDREQFPIHGIAAFRQPTQMMTRTFHLRVPASVERVVLDAPAGVGGTDLIELLRQADAVVIPVLPSSIDIHAASRFIQELLLSGKVRARGIRVAVVANRVQEDNPVYQTLQRFLNSLTIPFVARFQDTQNYILAAQQGVSVHELDREQKQQERDEWESLINWLEEGARLLEQQRSGQPA